MNFHDRNAEADEVIDRLSEVKLRLVLGENQDIVVILFHCLRIAVETHHEQFLLVNFDRQRIETGPCRTDALCQTRLHGAQLRIDGP